MSTILNYLFIAVAFFFFGGRLNEVIALTDVSTGFLIDKAVVTSPLMMAIICVIAVCCGVILFSGNYTEKKMKKMPVGIFGYIAGFFFIAGGIISSVNCFRFGGFIGYHIIEVLGGIGFVILGVNNLRGRSNEKIPMLLTILLCIGVCINSVVYEVKTIRDTDYMLRTLAGVTALAFLILMYRNVIEPEKKEKMMLYIAAQINFVFCGMGSLAAVIGGLIKDTSSFAQMLYNMGFVVLGVYSLFVALLISPSVITAGEKEEKELVKVRKPKQNTQPEYSAPEMNGDSFRKMPTGSIDKNAIEMLFAQKDEKEKQRESEYISVKTSGQEKRTSIEQTIAPVHAAQATEERTAVVYRPSSSRKSVYKGDGKKSTTSKIVYKAPK